MKLLKQFAVDWFVIVLFFSAFSLLAQAILWGGFRSIEEMRSENGLIALFAAIALAISLKWK